MGVDIIGCGSLSPVFTCLLGLISERREALPVGSEIIIQFGIGYLKYLWNCLPIQFHGVNSPFL